MKLGIGIAMGKSSGGGAPTILSKDTFTGSGLLSAHTPDVGPSWVIGAGAPAIVSNQLNMNVITSDVAFQNLASETNFTISFDFVATSNQQVPSLYFLSTSDAMMDGYTLFIDQANINSLSGPSLVLVDAAGVLAPASVLITPNTGTTHVVIKVVGSSLTVTLSGAITASLTYVMTEYLGNAWHGFTGDNNLIIADIFDNWLVTTP